MQALEVESAVLKCEFQVHKGFRKGFRFLKRMTGCLPLSAKFDAFSQAGNAMERGWSNQQSFVRQAP
jgi:hypothetical protein